MYEVKQFINSEPAISFSLPVRDWCLLEQSELWHRLDRFLEVCQSTDSQMSQQEKIEILGVLPKVVAKLSVKKIENGYADCDVRLVAVERKEEQCSNQQH